MMMGCRDDGVDPCEACPAVCVRRHSKMEIVCPPPALTPPRLLIVHSGTHSSRTPEARSWWSHANNDERYGPKGWGLEPSKPASRHSHPFCPRRMNRRACWKMRREQGPSIPGNRGTRVRSGRDQGMLETALCMVQSSHLQTQSYVFSRNGLPFKIHSLCKS